MAETQRRLFGLALVGSILSFGNLRLAIAENSPIDIDATNLKDVTELVAVMRKSAGSRLPRDIKNEQFYRAMSVGVINNMNSAVHAKIELPRFLLDRHPLQAESTAFVPVAIVIIRVAGVLFAIPIRQLFSIVLRSLWIMFILLTT